MNEDQREVSPFSREVMSPEAAQPLSDPLQIGIRLLPPPIPAVPWTTLASRFPLREDDGVTTFRRCTEVGKVAALRRWLDICAGRIGSVRPWPHAVLAQACQHLTLVLNDDV